MKTGGDREKGRKGEREKRQKIKGVEIASSQAPRNDSIYD